MGALQTKRFHSEIEEDRFRSPIPYEKLKKNSIIIEIEGEKILVISIHDLIQLKIEDGRKQDLADVEHLRVILEK